MSLIARLFGLVAIVVGLGLTGFALWSALFDPAGSWSHLVGIPLYLLMLGFGLARWRNEHGANEIALDADDPVIRESISRARAALPALQAQMGDLGNVSLKYGIPTEDGSIEHIWCTPSAFDGTRVTMTPANDPIGRLVLVDGTYNAPLAELEDFIVPRPDGTLLGGYSIVAIGRAITAKGKAIPRANLAMINATSAFTEWGLD